MRKLIKFRYCGWGLNYCPIFFGAKSDVPMQAKPNEVELERILSEEDLVNDKPTKDEPPKPIQRTFETQTSNNFMTETDTAVQIDFEDELVKDKPIQKTFETQDRPTNPIQRTFETQTSNTFMDSNNVMTETETAVQK